MTAIGKKIIYIFLQQSYNTEIYFSKKISKGGKQDKIRREWEKGMKKRLCLLLYIDSYGINQLRILISTYYMPNTDPGNTCWLHIK